MATTVSGFHARPVVGSVRTGTGGEREQLLANYNRSALLKKKTIFRQDVENGDAIFISNSV